MKHCKKCGEAKEKSLDFFYAHPQSKDGFHSWCKSCHKEWRDENKAKRINQMKNWVAQNLNYVKEKQAKYYQDNKEHRKQTAKTRAQSLANCPIEKTKKSVYGKKWRTENADKNRKKEANRRAKKIERTPLWFAEFDEFVVQQAAELAVMRENDLGGKWHIDHIIPLQGINVSGLHVASNFQVVPQRYNAVKSNNFDAYVGEKRFIG